MKKLTKKDFHNPFVIHLCKENENVRIIEDYGKFNPQKFNEGGVPVWKNISTDPCFTMQEAIDKINEYLNN